MIGLAVSRGLYVTIEQPLRSLFFKHPSVQNALELVQAQRFVTYLGEFGATSPKPLELFSTAPQDAVKQHLVRAGKGCRNVHKTRAKLTRKYGTWVCGTRALRQSQEYPPSFCKAYAALVHELLPPRECSSNADSAHALNDIVDKAVRCFELHQFKWATKRVTFTRKLRPSSAAAVIDVD